MRATPLVQIIMKNARYAGLGALFAVLPIAAHASIITEELDFTVNGLDGEATFTVDTSLAASDAPAGGAYADPNDGLLSLNLQYNGASYMLGDFLDTPFLPIVLLPGNADLKHGLQYELIGAVTVSGTCTGPGSGFFNCTGPGPSNEATILGFGPTVQSDFVTGVATVDASVSGSASQLKLTGNGITAVTGTITGESAIPEPGYAPLTALALAGLFFTRRRLRA
jgi:MYXO-CTERM domain-containing protein